MFSFFNTKKQAQTDSIRVSPWTLNENDGLLSRDIANFSCNKEVCRIVVAFRAITSSITKEMNSALGLPESFDVMYQINIIRFPMLGLGEGYLPIIIEHIVDKEKRTKKGDAQTFGMKVFDVNNEYTGFQFSGSMDAKIFTNMLENGEDVLFSIIGNNNGKPVLLHETIIPFDRDFELRKELLGRRPGKMF